MNGNGSFDPRKEAHLLSAYVDGELDAADLARVEAHLARPDSESGEARREIERLRRLKALTGAMRLKEPPPEEWEAFWENVYNRAERSVGWILLMVGVVVVGAWAALQVVLALTHAENLPLYVKGGIFVGAAGLLVLLVSVVRERWYARQRTRYKDVIR
ncbi:zf-HC2 domain-containing protein [bacterium]|nr:zf-HC2 domain-containing protein [bacterium]